MGIHNSNAAGAAFRLWRLVHSTRSQGGKIGSGKVPTLSGGFHRLGAVGRSFNFTATGAELGGLRCALGASFSNGYSSGCSCVAGHLHLRRGVCRSRTGYPRADPTRSKRRGRLPDQLVQLHGPLLAGLLRAHPISVARPLHHHCRCAADPTQHWHCIRVAKRWHYHTRHRSLSTPRHRDPARLPRWCAWFRS